MVKFSGINQGRLMVSVGARETKFCNGIGCF
jgi:hypothetical protein